MKLYHRITGTGEPIIFLHGLGSSGRDWELQVAELSRNYQCILPDMRGHGSSPRITDSVSIEMMTGDIIDILDRLDIQSAHVVGISMGGMIGMELALTAPNRVRSLVLVNSYPEINMRKPLTWLRVRYRLMLVRLFPMEFAARFLARRLFPKVNQENLRQTFIYRWSQNDKESYYQSILAILKWTALSRLGQIECPVLVAAGDRDYTSDAHMKSFVQKIPHARFERIVDSGHATPVDQPQALNRVIRRFLNQDASDRQASVQTGPKKTRDRIGEALRLFRMNPMPGISYSYDG